MIKMIELHCHAVMLIMMLIMMLCVCCYEDDCDVDYDAICLNDPCYDMFDYVFDC